MLNKLGIGCLGLVGLLVILGIVGAATGGSKSGANTTGTQSASATPTTPTSSPTSVTSLPAATTVMASAPTAAPRAKPTAAPLPKVGQVVSVKNWDLTVKGIEKPGQKLTWSEFGNTSDAVGTWLVIPIEMRNTGNENFGVNSFDFEIKDGKGSTYKTSTDLGAFGYSKYKGGADMAGSQVPPGVTAKYFLVFDVAPDATGLKLMFKQDKQPTIDLGQ